MGNVSLAKFKNENPGSVYEPLTDNVMDILRGTTSLAVENDYGKVSGALRLFYNWGHHKINDGYLANQPPQTDYFLSDDHNTGIMFYQSFRLFEGNSFTVGIDYKNWGGKAWNESIGTGDKTGDLADKSINETAGYLIVQQDLCDLLSLNAGIRYEHNSAFGGEWIPQGGIAVRPFEGNTIKASVSKGFRSPNIKEMYMFPLQNPDLKPESMMNYEVSVGQFAFENRFHAELTGFYIKGKNIIETLPVQGEKRKLNQNTGPFTNKGFEFETSYQILNNLTADANYSYLHTSKPLLAAPGHKLYAGVTYMPGRFTFNVSMQSVFDLYILTDDSGNKPENNIKEKYTTLNARAAYRFGTRDKGLNLFVKGENLTATRYSINDGFPMPKAIVMGGIELTF